MAQVLDEIDRLRDNSAVRDAPSDVALSSADVRAMLDGLLDAPHGRLDLRSGAVTVTAMVPVRNLPARVIALVGLEEGTLRSARSDGDDVLGARPCVGERDSAAEGRSLLLDALLAAEDHLVVTFDGNDITTNRQLPIPVHLGELLEVVSHTAGTADLVTRHPRRAHDERNFLAADGAPPFSFDGCMLEGAEARRTRRDDAAVVPVVLDVTVPQAVTLDQLADACTRPARTYLRDRLDVRLPRERENLDPSIPLSVTPLEVYTLGDDLLRRHHALRGGAVDAWRETTRLQGGLPPRELATAALGEVEEEVEQMLRALPDLRDMFCAATETVSVDIALDAPEWAAEHAASVLVRDTIGSVTGETLVRVAFTRPKARTRIASALTLAALIAACPDRPWSALLAMRGERSGGDPVVMRLLPLVPVGGIDEAREFLRTALDLRLRALREPLPIFEASETLFETGTIDDPDLERDLRDGDNEFLWGGMSSDDLLAIPSVHSDPFPDVVAAGASRPGRMAGYAHAVWQAYRDFAFESRSTP
jgi:exodeoxyribonuclease V gamma subunit